MSRKWVAASGLVFLVFVLLSWSPCLAAAQQQQSQQQQSQQPTYTIPEYNAFQAARAEKDPQARVKLLDDFVQKFPNSTLMPYIYQLYIDTYNQLKNYPKVVEYADRLIALGDKVQLDSRISADYIRSTAFEFAFNPKDPNSKDELQHTRDAADLGLKLLAQWQKPQTLTDDQYAQQKKLAAAAFNNAGGFAALQQKDYKAAANYYRASLAVTGPDPVTYYRLGVALLLESPPESMDGFWALARAVALKGPAEAQARTYLRKQMLAYQQPGCDNLIDAQMNELIQLATSSADRPATYNIPSSADLDKVRQSSNILSVISDLKAGGDKAKVTWLAVCGSEFPEVVGKVLEVTPSGDNVDLKVYTGATSEEMEAATTPNMEVKVIGQPEASRLQKDDGVRFSGTLASYDPEPFLLHWDKCKVNPEDIPAQKAEPGRRRPHRVPPKKPGQK